MTAEGIAMNIRYSFILLLLCAMHINLQAMLLICSNKLDPETDGLLKQYAQLRLYNLHNPTMKMLLQTTITYSYLQAHNLFNQYNESKITSSDTRTAIKNVLANAQYEIYHVLRIGNSDNFQARLSFLCAHNAMRFACVASFHDYRIGKFFNIEMACSVGHALKKMHEQFPMMYDQWRANPTVLNKLAIDWLVEETEF
jgi:hypothetical protein